MSIGAIEPKFYAILLEKLNLNENDCPHFYDFEKGKEKFGKIFKEKTQKEWCEIFDGSDACCTPVLTLETVKNHQHNKARGTFFHNNNDTLIPNPAPKLSRTPGISSVIRNAIPEQGEHSIEILSQLGYNSKEINEFISSGIVHSAKKPSKL